LWVGAGAGELLERRDGLECSDLDYLRSALDGKRSALERKPSKHFRTHTHKLEPLNHFIVVPHPLIALRFNSVFILVSVNDLMVAGEKLAGVGAVKRSVSAKFEVRDMGEVNDFIGMRVMRDREAQALTLSNSGHTATLLEAFGMETSTPYIAPMASGVDLAKTGEDLLPDRSRNLELVGSLLYLSTTTMPAITFAVGVFVAVHVLP